MNLATGAMGSLLLKLGELLADEYKLQKGIKEGVRSLEKEMKSMHAALRVVGEVPRDQLDELVKLWAEEVRELSFDMEDIVDKFLVRVDDGSEPATKSIKLKRLMEKMAGLFKKGKARHEIADAIKEINKQVQEVSNRRGRYAIDNIIAKPAAATAIDPRLGALYTEVTELVGIAGKRDQELLKLLSEGDDETKNKLKIVSVVGFGGLGKTTLVKMVYEKIKGDFDCSAFVPVGRNAGAKKVFMDILHDIYKIHFTDLDEKQLIDKLREGLNNRRYLIVIDDIWDEKLWRVIKLAFPSSSNVGSRLITTTRIVSVAKLCCPSNNDSVYQMEPLSADDSQRLFYRRIFSHESECPQKFEALSKDILKKCGGVPLAIITIASLLASDQHVKPVDEWHVLLESIGRGLTEDPSVEEMLRILSFSYYDMPSHLKTCLLYLGMFPEDYEIGKDRLIWMWIAENFIQCDKAGACAFEIGEAFFNELVNRNMIIPVYYNDDDGTTTKGCQVHDMVLDLIYSLSSEDNFVTVLNSTSHSMSSRSSVRRLSLQNAMKGELQTTPLGSTSMLQVRSIVTFKAAIDLMPSFSRFVVLRVLDLTNCDLSLHDHLDLRELGSLLHLRYLGLANTGTSELPEEIGNLQFLQVLDVRRNVFTEVPSTVIKLKRLLCLLVNYDHKLPDGLGNLTSLEVLTEMCCFTPSTVKELGSMVRLRKLKIQFEVMSLEMEEAFVESLGKMSNMQSIEITHAGMDDKVMDILGERWVAPRSLQKFNSDGYTVFSILPAWIRSHLSQLCTLKIWVKEVREEDLNILGSLPGLSHLDLRSDHQSRLLPVSADGFPCLTMLGLMSFSPGHVVVQPGALPKLKKVIRLSISLRVAKEEAAGNVNGGVWFDLNIWSFPSLESFRVNLYRSGVTVGEAKQKKAALENALRAHPNRPSFKISFRPAIPSGARDDDVCCSEGEED